MCLWVSPPSPLYSVGSVCISLPGLLFCKPSLSVGIPRPRPEELSVSGKFPPQKLKVVCPSIHRLWGSKQPEKWYSGPSGSSPGSSSNPAAVALPTLPHAAFDKSIPGIPLASTT